MFRRGLQDDTLLILLILVQITITPLVFLPVVLPIMLVVPLIPLTFYLLVSLLLLSRVFRCW